MMGRLLISLLLVFHEWVDSWRVHLIKPFKTQCLDDAGVTLYFLEQSGTTDEFDHD